MLADQPLLTGTILDQWVGCYQQTSSLIVTAAYAKTLGVSSLFDRHLFSALCNLLAPAGAKQLVRRYTNQAEEVPLPKGAVDIDTPLDHEQLQNRPSLANLTFSLHPFDEVDDNCWTSRSPCNVFSR